jgi:simple sugar transport system permease protein
MNGLLTAAFLSSLFGGAVVAGVPLLLAGLGELVSEKAGVLNIGIEGMMLAGAYAGFVVAYDTGSMEVGFVAGVLAGMAVAAIMALACVRMGLNQIVVGIALTLCTQGVTALLQFFEFSRTYPRLPRADAWSIPLLSSIPVIGPGLFQQHPLAYLAVAACIGLSWVFRHTFLGLSLAAAGDKPAALDAAGTSVVATRTLATLFTGGMAGLGGAYLSEVGSGIFIPFMTNGAGFVGIVLAMLARGRPAWVLYGAALFGACLSLTTALQVAGVNVPTDVIQMIPFAAVMAALIAFGRRAGLPAALGLPYLRGAR